MVQWGFVVVGGCGLSSSGLRCFVLLGDGGVWALCGSLVVVCWYGICGTAVGAVLCCRMCGAESFSTSWGVVQWGFLFWGGHVSGNYVFSSS